MKKIKYIMLMFAAISIFACDNSGDTITLSGAKNSKLIASETNLVLSNATSGDLVLSLVWNVDTLSISQSDKYGIPESALKNTLQFSTQSDFSSVKESVEVSNSKAYTGSDLNALALSLGLQTDTVADIYVRVKTVIAANVDIVYSNTVKLSVTPYEQVSFLYMPKPASYTDFSWYLCSRSGDGEYEGFVNANQWDNFKFTPQTNMNGTVYGSNPSDLYSLDASNAQYNIWFDEGGYFLIKASTNSLTWSKTAITSFAVTGEFNAWSITSDLMTYNAATNTWSATVNISTTLYGIQIIANNDWNFKFGQGNDADELLHGSATNIPVAAPGTYTITIDLSKAEKYTYTIN